LGTFVILQLRKFRQLLPSPLPVAKTSVGNYRHRMPNVDDAVQSAFASFWKRAADGEFGKQLDRFNMWNLLGVITVRKSLRHVRHERAAKRRGEPLMNADGTPMSRNGMLCESPLFCSDWRSMSAP
jgi:hypothetical protein